MFKRCLTNLLVIPASWLEILAMSWCPVTRFLEGVLGRILLIVLRNSSPRVLVPVHWIFRVLKRILLVFGKSFWLYLYARSLLNNCFLSKRFLGCNFNCFLKLFFFWPLACTCNFQILGNLSFDTQLNLAYLFQMWFCFCDSNNYYAYNYYYYYYSIWASLLWDLVLCCNPKFDL